MGQYKVPQDVEAEDKIIGFLTLKQFIYAVIGLAYGLLTFQLLKGALFIWVIVGIPPAGIMLLLGLYQRDGQPFEAYFLALVNFWFKPRRRIWVKEDIIEVFKIEQPKVLPHMLRQDPREVRGQLEKLAQIVDTRGWAAKQPEVQEPDNMVPVIDLNNRLSTNELSSPSVDPVDVSVADDMLDLNNNPSARNLNVLIQDSSKSIREEAMAIVQPEAPKPTTKPSAPAPDTTTLPAASTSEMTANPITDILKRAMENSDLKVSQVSQIASRQPTPGELVEGQSTNLRSSKN